MSLSLAMDQVLALAPDPASVAAGKKLARPGSWRNLGHGPDALWGECQGSALYQTQVALSDFATTCSCPSRKFPCKHALGLMLIAAASPAEVPPANPPEWVTEWLEKRGAAQAERQARAQTAAARPVDAAAQARRTRKREANVLSGLDQLDAWLEDVVRQGLARIQGEPPSFWDTQARRLVDAQVPGLASRVRRIAETVGASRTWTERALDELGTLALVTQAFRRLEALPPALQHDLRRAVGYTLEQSEVIAHGDLTEDDWRVTGEVTSDEDAYRTQRAWLIGERSGRTALVLQFAAGAARFPEALVTGTRFRARLAFWPSAHPRRALVAERLGAPAAHASPPRGSSIAESLTTFAAALGQLPWLERDLAVLSGVRVRPGDPWSVLDSSGRLPLRRGEHDVLLAVSGGEPVMLAGEWDGYELLPLVTWIDGRVVALGGVDG